MGNEDLPLHSDSPTGAAPQQGLEENSAVTSPAADSAGIARAAGINSLGNVASRVLGLVRVAIVADIFGASGLTSAFEAASYVPKMIYELLIGGMLSAALVPVLSEYTGDGEGRDDLSQIVGTLLTLTIIVMLVLVVALEIAAPWVAKTLVVGFNAELRDVTTALVRVILPAILIYGVSGILQAFHYSARRFVYPAMGAPAHNAGFIVATLLLARYLDITSLSVAVLLAATLQLLVQVYGLRHIHIRPALNWSHPALRRILGLYAPVVLSIVISNIGIIVDRNLASRTVEQAITWMAYATYLIQFPLGLVSMAISLAVLPTLSQIDTTTHPDEFKRVLSLGLRLVLTLIIPAAVGLFVLAHPVIQLIFEHGEFMPSDTVQTVRALRYYLLGLPFAAIDLPLVFAFYARKNTITPVVVGILGVVIYLIVGPTLAFGLNVGYIGLVIANAVQLTSHALIMVVLLRRDLGGVSDYGITRTTIKATLAALVMGVGAFFCQITMVRVIHLDSPFRELLVLGVSGGIGGLIYLGLGMLLGMEEIRLIGGIIHRRFGR